MANPKLGLANDLFEDMGRKVADAQQAGDEEDIKVVDEIESLCMNCHANVSLHLPSFRVHLLITCAGHDSTPPYQNPLLPRNHNHVLLLPSLRL
jgi:hypothetical protein